MTASLKRTAPFSVKDVQKNQYDSGGVLASDVVNAKSSVLYVINGYNNSASTRYFQLFNSATVPADAVVPDLLPVAVAAAGTFTLSLPSGVVFATGLSWASSSTLLTKTVTGVADMWVTITYK